MSLPVSGLIQNNRNSSTIFAQDSKKDNLRFQQAAFTLLLQSIILKTMIFFKSL